MFNHQINNVLLITIDSLRFDRLGFNSEAINKTPTIDFLAKNGVNCINTTSHGCPTQIAMPSMFSSSLPLDYGGYDYGIKNRPKVLPEVLKENNINTVGFTAGSALTSYFGYERGLDNYFHFTSIDLIWFSYRKIYYKYYLKLFKNNTYSEKKFYQIINQSLNELFLFMINYCTDLQKMQNHTSIEIDYRIESINYSELKKAIIREKRRLNSNSKKYIIDNLERLNPTTLTYDAQSEKLDLYNYFFHSNKKLKITEKFINYFLQNFLKKLIDRFFSGWIKINREYEGLSDDKTIVNNICKWIEDSDNKNKFLWAHLSDLHAKMYNNNLIQIPLLQKNEDKILQKGSDGSYDLSLKETDNNIKILIDKLSDKGILDNTLIIISSDHGHDAGFPNRKFGIGSASFYEEYVHIPLIFYHTGIKPRTIDYQCCAMDIAPTILDILGIDIPVEFQGYSIFSSKIKSREYVLLEHTHRGPNDINNKPYYIAARSSDGYKLIWKEYIYEYDPTKYQYEMYDLKKDPYEQNNIYFDASFQDKRLEMEYVIKERFSLISKMRKKE